MAGPGGSVWAGSSAPPALAPGVEAGDVGQLLEQLPLAAAEPLGHHDQDLGGQVAGPAPRVGHALAAQPQPPAAGGAGRDLDLGLPARGVDRHVGPQGRLPRGYGQVCVEVASVQAVARVGQDADDQVQVAGRGAAGAPAALAGQADPLAVHHPGWDGHLVAALAVRAGQVDPAAAAAVRLLDRELELGLLVGAGDRPAAAAEQAAEQVIKVDPAQALVAEAAFVDVDPLAPFVHVHPAAPPAGLGPATAETAEPGPGGLPLGPLGDPPEVGTEAVVAGPGVGVGEDLVGLVHLLEAVLGARVLVDVGVVTAGQPPVGLLQLLGAGRARAPEELVVVAGHGLTPSGRWPRPPPPGATSGPPARSRGAAPRPPCPGRPRRRGPAGPPRGGAGRRG